VPDSLAEVQEHRDWGREDEVHQAKKTVFEKVYNTSIIANLMTTATSETSKNLGKLHKNQ